jgi:hypothetical protein
LQISTSLIWIRITIVSVKFFRRVEGLKIGKRAAIKFCVKLQKTSTETFEMLISEYGEECLSRTSVFE